MKRCNGVVFCLIYTMSESYLCLSKLVKWQCFPLKNDSQLVQPFLHKTRTVDFVPHHFYCKCFRKLYLSDHFSTGRLTYINKNKSQDISVSAESI